MRILQGKRDHKKVQRRGGGEGTLAPMWKVIFGRGPSNAPGEHGEKRGERDLQLGV